MSSEKTPNIKSHANSNKKSVRKGSQKVKKKTRRWSRKEVINNLCIVTCSKEYNMIHKYINIHHNCSNVYSIYI